ncbi:MAG: hypothetical protein ABIJ31_14855 [Pseudomonadota bacterium]
MIPKFDNYHANMHSDFLRFDPYINFLKHELFNGYVLGDLSDRQCYMMLVDGEPQVYFLKRSNQSTVQSIKPDEFETLIKNNCFIASYKGAPRYITFLSRCHTAKKIYNNLTSDSISPAKLIEKCQAGSFSGCIEANGGSEKKKFVYFDNGKIVGAMNVESNTDLFENQVNTKVLYGVLKNYSLNLYEFSKQMHTYDVVAGYRNSLIQCYQEILQLLEKNAMGQDFSSAWRICAMELSQKYSFMDPFVAEFVFENGKIDLWEEVDTKEAGNAMDELCESIAKKVSMPRDGIKEIKDKYIKILSAYEIRN